jgi:cyclophilin family peptidyl-prolyl cis-trans isomerase
MVSLRSLPPLVLACASLPPLAGPSPASAANLPPELATALPAQVVASGAPPLAVDLSSHLRDPDVAKAARISVRLGATTKTIDLALLVDAAPLTVANFLSYVDSGRYAANFFHRSVPGFIIQNGGFYFVNDNTFDYVPAFAPVVNEFGVSNTRGTVAMAKLGGDPNSATSQWFINLADNSANLDAQNGGFTVFARVLGTGMGVADEIAAVPRYNASTTASAWTDLPLTAPYLARPNFIETSVSRLAPLSHQVSSDDPALVTASVSGDTLVLGAAAGRTGATTIRLTSTDLEGATLSTSLAVTVSADPLLAWRQTHFGATTDTGAAADLADPDGDGMPNLLEYAVGAVPVAPSGLAIAVGRVDEHLTLAYARVADPALIYTVETADSLAGPWTTLAAEGNPSTGTANVAGTITITDPAPLSEHPRRFLRLRVAR